MQKCMNCSHVSEYHCSHLLYTTQHRAVLIIFLLILQTSTELRCSLLEEMGTIYSEQRAYCITHT